MAPIFIIRVNNMKYQVGDLVFVKDVNSDAFHWNRPLPHLPLRLHLHPHLHPHLVKSFGIITQAIKNNVYWKSHSTSDDNIYVWFSQIDGKEYRFYENEVDGEVIK